MRRAASNTALLAALALVGCGGEGDLGPGSPFAISVVDYDLGEGAGFGEAMLPDIVLGPPRGGGLSMGSVDTLSLGLQGSIVVELGAIAVDGPGPDLIVFENAFHFAGTTLFTEPGIVSFSEDGRTWIEVPCDVESPELTGCAGRAPVFANAETNDIDPTDPNLAGGDAFDLANVGVTRARFVRIVDGGIDRGFGGDNVGFDLDAIAVVHPE
jgi:hypothetical protein